MVTTSSGSASSSETLKWHGSLSDVSISSGMPQRHHHGSMSDVSLNSALIPPAPKQNGDKWQGSSGIHDEALKNRSGEQQWQFNDSGGKSRSSMSNNVNGESINQWHESSIDEDAQVTQKVKQWDSTSSRINTYKYSLPPQPMPQSPTRPVNGNNGNNNGQVATSNGNWNGSHHESMTDISQMNGVQSNSKQLIAHSARVQTPQRHHSESVLYLDRERNQRSKLFPLSTTQPQETNQTR